MRESARSSVDINQEGANLILEERNNEGTVGFSTYFRFLSQSTRIWCNLGSLILSVAPFVLWDIYVCSLRQGCTSVRRAREYRFKGQIYTVITLISITISGFTTFLIGLIFV